MQKKPSPSVMSEIAERIMKLKKASEESGLDLTQELLKTLTQLSDIPRSITSGSKSSEESFDLDESMPIHQPTNSLLSDSAVELNGSLITTIKNKNLELQKTCSEKILELQSTTKTFCSISKMMKKKATTSREASPDKLRAESKPRACSDCHLETCLPSENNLEIIIMQLSQLKSEISLVNNKVVQSHNEILKQNKESIVIQGELETLLEESIKAKNSCGCGIF